MSSTTVHEEVKQDLETLQKAIADTFKCGICYGLLRETVFCPLGHAFCRPCAQRALRARSSCPACRRPMTERDLVMGRMIDDFLSEAIVRCTNGDVSRGEMCTWKGPYSRLTDHDDVCGKKEINCEDCQDTVRRVEIERHKEVCREALVECRACGNTARRNRMMLHLEYMCPEKRVQCALHCGREVTRRGMGHHILTECQRKWDECPIPGCGAVTQAQEAHERQEVTTHNFLLRQAGASGGGEHMVHGPLHSLQWAVADPTRSVRSPTFPTSGDRRWEAMTIPPSRGVSWCVCLRLVAGPPALAKIRIKMSADGQEDIVSSTAAMLPGDCKKWEVQNITNTRNITIQVLIQH